MEAENQSRDCLIRIFKLSYFAVEGSDRHVAGCCCLFQRQSLCLPRFVYFGKVIGKRKRRSAKLYPFDFGCRNAFRLPLPNVGALVFRNKGKHLQNDVAEEGSHQIFAPACVQQRHVQNHNVNAFFLSQASPVYQDLLIIAPQTVNAFDVEQIVFFDFPEQLLVLRSVKVFAGFLICIDIVFRYTDFLCIAKS